MSDDIHPDKHGEATRHRENVKREGDSVSDDTPAYTADEPSCMNCQSKDTEEVFSEAGQYIGKWCADCGVMNRSGGVFTKPNETVSKADLRELIEEWRKSEEHMASQGVNEWADGIKQCADDLEDLL
ncbi:MAG: hypothetical protein HQRvContig01_8 [Haloquadratum phage sp.]|nr:MAG: hypothetical protein HQRvContig01_8 [Haloquadratum phage sp.]